MAIDMSAISNLSTGLSQSVSRLSSVASTVSRSLPNITLTTPLPAAARQITTALSSPAVTSQLQGVASSLQNTVSSFVGTIQQQPIAQTLAAAGAAASAASAAGQIANQLGSVTSFIRSASPQSVIGAVGGDFSRAIQAINTFNSQFAQTLNQMSGRIPNPLRDYNHYNYIITLGILGIQQINNPLSYRNGEFDRIILRSGGGQYDRRQRVYLEQGEDAEYFIENLNIDALIAPNERTGIALGTTVEFEVIEPYSMGKFIEALIAAAGSTGYNSFNNAPYCLKIEFNGWDEYGQQSLPYTSPYYIPIIITKVDFNVKEGGSVYRVQAVPYSEIALSTHVDVIHTDINASGRFVHEVLENGNKSVTNIINNNLQGLEENTTLRSYDKYIILFPSTPTTIMEAIGSGIITREGQRVISEQAAEFTGVRTTEMYNPRLRQFFENRVSTRVNTEIYQILKSLAVDTSRMNNLGNSRIAVESNSGVTRMASPPDGIYDDAILRIARRNAPAAQPVLEDAEHIFDQGTRITEIINSVLLDSEEVRNEAARELGDSSPSMYRLETYTFVVDNPEIERIIGRPPRIYVYAVHPYISDQAHYLAPNQRPRTTAQLLRNSVKEYNYFYTGKNEDIIDFDITYNYSFIQAVFSDFGQLTAAERVSTQRSAVSGQPTPNISPPVTDSGVTRGNPSVERFPFFDRTASGSQLSDASSQLARQMHNIFINSNVDLINAEMKIWGDPYYLPTILGNYSPPQQTSMLTQDSTINYLRNDVTVVVNFINPLDYEVAGPLMTFNNEVNPAFSGVYQVLGVTSQFTKGQFVQDIKMLRQRGQEIEDTSSAERILVTNGGGGLNTRPPSQSRFPSGRTTTNTVASPSASGAAVPSQNPAAQLTSLGTVIDARVGIWANQAISTAASAASSIIPALTNPITALTNVGRVLADAPATLQSVLSSVRINTTLTPPTTPRRSNTQ